MTCTHSEEEQHKEIGSGACPLCLGDELRLLQLKQSVAPGLVQRLHQEIEVLYRVIEKLGGK